MLRPTYAKPQGTTHKRNLPRLSGFVTEFDCVAPTNLFVGDFKVNQIIKSQRRRESRTLKNRKDTINEQKKYL